MLLNPTEALAEEVVCPPQKKERWAAAPCWTLHAEWLRRGRVVGLVLSMAVLTPPQCFGSHGATWLPWDSTTLQLQHLRLNAGRLNF